MVVRAVFLLNFLNALDDYRAATRAELLPCLLESLSACT